MYTDNILLQKLNFYSGIFSGGTVSDAVLHRLNLVFSNDDTSEKEQDQKGSWKYLSLEKFEIDQVSEI